VLNISITMSDEMEAETAEPFLVVRPRKFTLEERKVAIRTIIGGDTGEHGSGSLDRSTDDRAIVPATGVAEAWSEYLREAIPPRGWLAVWDMNASKDYRFYGSARQIEAPVCVDVISIDFKDLEAKIQVVQAPDAFSNLLDEEFRTVPLTSLIPIHYDDEDKTEDRAPPTPESDDPNVSSVSATEETAIAVALDHYRFFFAYLWRSFDAGDEDTMDWIGERLDNRVGLYAEYVEDGEAAKNWRKSKRLETEFDDLQEKLEDMNLSMSSSAEDQSDSDVGTMLGIEAREREIRRDALIIENPEFRNATRVARINKLKESRPEGRRKTVLVWPVLDQEGEMGLFRKVWDALTEKLGGDKSLFSVAKDLPAAILECLAGDTVVLPNLGTEWRESPSTYVTDDLGELEEGGGTLMGIDVGSPSCDATVALLTKIKNESDITLDGVTIQKLD